MVCHLSEILEDIDFLWTLMIQKNNTIFTWDPLVAGKILIFSKVVMIFEINNEKMFNLDW